MRANLRRFAFTTTLLLLCSCCCAISLPKISPKSPISPEAPSLRKAKWDHAMSPIALSDIEAHKTTGFTALTRFPYKQDG
ncbi:hypothetical protein B0T13DRAFT_465659 [Neurospora crassa]|nr:hypothetical protein B0T13DRAFT_465659 [Neurospora crassa]